MFGTSRQISMGPSSGLAAVAAGAVLAAGITDGAEVATFVAGITLAAGLLFLVLAVLRLGWIARFLSRAVVTGFLFGAAIDVVIGELPKLTGSEGGGDNTFQQLRLWIEGLGDTQPATLVVGLVALVVVFGLRVVAPAVPGALVLVVGGLLATPIFDLAERGVALVGDIPSGCPSAEVPDLGLWADHASVVAAAAFALVLIGFSQTVGDARAFATKHRYQVDVNQETVAQGVANVGAGLLQGMPVTTSLSASSLNDQAGARTGLASLTSGGIVVLTLVFLAPLFSDLPKPVLAALIIDAVVMGMMDVPEMRRLARVQRFDFWVAVTAILGMLAFGVLAGVVFGVALSLLWLVSVTTRPALPLLGRRPGTTVFRELTEFPEDEQFPGVAVIRLDGGLFFATSDALDERVRQMISETPDVACVVLDCSSISFVDSQGWPKLAEVLTIADEENGDGATGPREAGRPGDAGARRRPQPHPVGAAPCQCGPRRGHPAGNPAGSGGYPESPVPGHPTQPADRLRSQFSRRGRCQMMHTVTSGTDAPTFEQYAGTAWPTLYRYAYLLAGNHADAEDIASRPC